MHALSRSPISDTHFFISGAVAIDPTAAIAPGVLIQADPGAQVVIGAGACIGRGSIIHASSGTVELGEGVTLGTGVLLFGACRVGASACLGANVTVISHTVSPGQLVPANSVLSALEIPSETLLETDVSDSGDGDTESSPELPQTEASIADPWADPAPEPDVLPSPESPSEANGNADSTPSMEVHAAEIQTTRLDVTTQRVVYGKSSLDHVLAMMFPHRQPLNSSSQPDAS